jgi:hypothetical protein
MVKQKRNEVCDHLVELIMLFEGFLSLSLKHLLNPERRIPSPAEKN